MRSLSREDIAICKALGEKTAGRDIEWVIEEARRRQVTDLGAIVSLGFDDWVQFAESTTQELVKNGLIDSPSSYGNGHEKLFAFHLYTESYERALSKLVEERCGLRARDPKKMPSRTDLIVHFEQKDEVKRLGARWDGQKRVWYVPEGVDPALFQKWLPNAPDINVRANHYYIIESSKSCWKCGGPTRVFALALPVGHDVLEAIEDDDMEFESDEAYEAWVNSPESSEWRTADMMASLHYVDHVPCAVEARIKALSPHFRVDFSKTTESSYWMNHCECCGMKQGDFDMHCEPGGAFVPLSLADAAQMIVYRVDESFEANYGGYTYDVEFFSAMQRA